MKFTDDTAVVGVIFGGAEMPYREYRLVTWSTANNLLLNTSKINKMVMDWRRKRGEPAPLLINCLERVSFGLSSGGVRC